MAAKYYLLYPLSAMHKQTEGTYRVIESIKLRGAWDGMYANDMMRVQRYMRRTHDELKARFADDMREFGTYGVFIDLERDHGIHYELLWEIE